MYLVESLVYKALAKHPDFCRAVHPPEKITPEKKGKNRYDHAKNRHHQPQGRRLTACKQLADEGDKRFESLPCLILDSRGELDDKIALITANATARDLTDGERVAQYEALKDALTRKKKAGQLEGKVRDECCRILGLSSGAAARLNVIATCENETIKLARKTLDDKEAWTLYLCEPEFRVEYYKQSLPGGATLWMRLDEIAKERLSTAGYVDYAIILQDKSFYTDGWIGMGCIVDDLVKWFNLTDN